MAAHRFCVRTAAPPGTTAAVVALLLLLGVLSATPAAAATGTYVRLAQLTAGAPGTEVAVTSVADPTNMFVLGALEYGALSEYRRVEPGDYVLALRPAGSALPPVVSATLQARAGMTYTLAVLDSGAPGLKILTDDLTPPAPGQSRVRVINAGSPSDQLDVRVLGGEPLALGLKRGDAGSYRSVAAGDIVLTVGVGGGVATNIPITVGANQVVSVVLVLRGGALVASVRVDAEGPAAMPPGQVHAGFGGAAEPRPGAATDVLVLLGLAAVAAGLSAHLALRGRSPRRRQC